MAKASIKLINGLRSTARKLEEDHSYQWGHMGACNCGNLVQELTSMTRGQIHEYAMRGHGDWSEQAEAFCPTSTMPMDLLIGELIANGLSLDDIIHLERLNDLEVLKNIPLERRQTMKHNVKSDVILYLNVWADLLEQQLLRKVETKTPDMVLS